MRVAGITLPEKKRMEIALTAVYGIGRPKAKEILDEAGIDFGKKPNELTDDEESKIRQIVDGMKIEGDLKREISSHVKRLIDIKSYRGSRHTKKLPLRGQNTKTNSRTLKGSKKTMGSGRKSADKK
jgi:small subunit ribosomal protein S13